MRTNPKGLELIKIFRDEDEYDFLENKRNAENLISEFIRVPLTSNQFSALVSFIMSEGREAFLKSKLRRLINGSKCDWKKFVKAADEFDKYIYLVDLNGVRVIDEFLIWHRMQEKKLFLKPEIVKSRKKKVG